MKRRDFLKTMGFAGTTALLPEPAAASDASRNKKEFVGVLVDVSLCIGCRECEKACAEEHGLPVPDIKDKTVFEQVRPTSTTQWTVVNRYITEHGPVYVKKQCMHCNEPACASACLVKAMDKTKEGPVIWHADRCMGCRFCMISCPFDIPKFEYNSPNPKIEKCILCYDRLQEGQIPACVEGCPVEALKFGTRRELLDLAKSRIYNHPDKYVHHVYGEHEAGGTGWLYISPVPFGEIGLPTNLGTTPYPEYSKEFLYSVPLVLLLWPPFLFGANKVMKGRSEHKVQPATVEKGNEE